MRIAFDLDDTLIQCSYEFPLEKPTRRLWAKLLGGELLQQGVVAVAEYCRQREWEVWVYITSYRSSWYIRKLFWLHGIHVTGVINQQRYNQVVAVRCTKHPPSFGIDLLIDDSEGVRLEARLQNDYHSAARCCLGVESTGRTARISASVCRRIARN